MQLTFRPVSLEEAGEYYALWEKTPQRSIDYSLVNLWGWQKHYGLEWAMEGGLCFLRQTAPRGTVLWAPAGDWNSADWESLLEPGMTFVRVPSSLAGIWRERLGDRIEAVPARGQWEYVYGRDDLADLRGNRYHKKKNHVLGYAKAYGQPDYRPLSSKVVEDCLALQDTWCQWHDCDNSPSLRAENDAINRVLVSMDRFGGLYGGALYIDGAIVAFSIGERLDGETMGVHFEKGLNAIRGVYQTINNVFVREACAGLSFVNRAQDMDEEGLRQAKESYLPARFLEKFTVTVR